MACEAAQDFPAHPCCSVADCYHLFRLSLDQKEVIRARLKLLQYSDRLSTYEEILGGIHAAEDRFDHKFFQTFRAQNIVELATDYAQVRCRDRGGCGRCVTNDSTDSLCISCEFCKLTNYDSAHRNATGEHWMYCSPIMARRFCRTDCRS